MVYIYIMHNAAVCWCTSILYSPMPLHRRHATSRRDILIHSAAMSNLHAVTASQRRPDVYMVIARLRNAFICAYACAQIPKAVCTYMQWRVRVCMRASGGSTGGGQLPPPPPFSSLPFSFLLVVCVVTVHTTPALHGARRSPPKYVAQKARASPVGDSPTPATILKYTYS